MQDAASQWSRKWGYNSPALLLSSFLMNDIFRSRIHLSCHSKTCVDQAASHYVLLDFIYFFWYYCETSPIVFELAGRGLSDTTFCWC